MAKSTYDAALGKLLEHEGGYTNHPSDPGGPTNWGITIYDAQKYAAEFGWILDRKPTAQDVRTMPISFAKLIYRRKYWDPQLLDLLEPGVDYAMFDYGVNSGVGRSGRVLRRIIGMPDTSSQVTLEVVDVANRMPARDLAAAICDERIKFLHSLKTWGVFGKGWGRRVADVRAFSLQIADDLPVLAGPPMVPAPGRAIDPDKFSRVRALQQTLAAAGLYDGAIDGDLGPKSIRAFQRWKNLHPVDGIVGRVTRPLLDAALAMIMPAVAVS